ncbi:MAG: alternative ribosome rescue aminoacyl-tRNA hydrolase ArfB [Thermodesulfobacteriota bacterium]
MITVTAEITLEENEIRESFVRSSGPGGQNVNKVATAVQLRFDAARSPSLPEDVRRRLLGLAGRRASREGVLLIDARRHRTREMNRREALDRLLGLIRQAAEKPRKRRRTKVPAAARKQRLDDKRRRAEMKNLRRRPAGTEG